MKENTNMKRFVAATVTALTLALPAAALDLNSMTDAERTAFRAEVRAYLLDNPDVIMEAVAVLEQRQAANQEQSDVDLVRVNAEELFNDGYSWTGGNPHGDITLVEFTDYRCGYCRKAHGEVAELIKSDGNIRFILKEYPILGEASVMTARFAIASKQVAGDEAYHNVHDALMTFNGEVNEVTLRRIADGLALDSDAIIAKMDSEDVTAVIAANHALGARMQINGTPSFVMNEQMLRGYLPLESMQQVVAEIRSK